MSPGYPRLFELAYNARKTDWSTPKDVQPGDRALIYIQLPQSAIIAKCVIRSNAYKTSPDDSYDYRATVDTFKVLPKDWIDIRALKRAFPGWSKLHRMQSHATVPEKYAEKLWATVHKK